MNNRMTVFHDLLADAGMHLCEQLRQGMSQSLLGDGERAAQAYRRGAILIPPIMIVRDGLQNGFDEISMQRLMLLAGRVEALTSTGGFALGQDEKGFAKEFLASLETKQ